MMNNIVDIHADDYAYTLNTSKDIIDCIKKGNLNSFSIIPNTSYFDESIDLLYKEIPNFKELPLISIHLNLVEGYCLSSNGFNTKSWSKILLESVFNRKGIKKYLKAEIREQIFKCEDVINNCIEIATKNNVPFKQRGLRIDSHTHTHSIPLVFESLIEVINEEKLNIEYIRNPKEPIKPFIESNLNFKLINYIKNIILNIFSKRIDKYCDENNLNKEYMWGLIMSSEMDFDRINKLYPLLLDKAIKNNRKLEILFHPGLALSDEYSNEMNKEYYNSFNSSNNRKKEKDSVYRINEILG